MKKSTQTFFDGLNSIRSTAINDLMSESKLSEIDATLKYDFEMAKMTTNRKMLEMIGITISKEFDTDDEVKINDLFNVIISGLKLWNIEVLNYSHLSKLEQFSNMQRILDETVRLLPPKKGCHAEYIDMGRIPSCQTDHFFIL